MVDLNDLNDPHDLNDELVCVIGRAPPCGYCDDATRLNTDTSRLARRIEARYSHRPVFDVGADRQVRPVRPARQALLRRAHQLGDPDADWHVLGRVTDMVFDGAGRPTPAAAVRAAIGGLSAADRAEIRAAARRVYRRVGHEPDDGGPPMIAVATAIALGRQFFQDAHGARDLFDYAAIATPHPELFVEIFGLDPADRDDPADPDDPADRDVPVNRDDPADPADHADLDD